MKQRDKHTRGLTLGRMLGILFALSHTEDIPTLSGNLVMSCPVKFKMIFYASCNLLSECCVTVLYLTCWSPPM